MCSEHYEVLKDSDSNMNHAHSFPTSGTMGALPNRGPDCPSDPQGKGTETCATTGGLDTFGHG